jgi:Arc/MetJ family transcription regulator
MRPALSREALLLWLRFSESPPDSRLLRFRDCYCMVVDTYFSCMKITLNIDPVLLRKAQEIAGTTSKTTAIDLALRDFVQRGSLLAALDDAQKLSPEEWGAAVDPNYDVMAMRVAETASTYGGKTRPRR